MQEGVGPGEKPRKELGVWKEQAHESSGCPGEVGPRGP